MADLSGRDLTQVNLSGAHLTRANLVGTDLTRAQLIGAHINDAKLTDAHLTQAQLPLTNLNNADLSRAKLAGANLTRAFLGRASLGKADLSGANLAGANLAADLTEADLTGANLIEADLSGAYLTWTNLDQSIVGRTIFDRVDLSDVKGLETVVHSGPSTLGVDALYRSQGKIPEIFLRGGGLPDTFIDYVGSLVGRPIEYYSCFISYSSKDQKFADRLHADLQNNAVRCWFAPHDLPIGAKTRVAIDEAIRLHDKLLLALTKDSVASDWVEKEVETAMEQERKEGRLVLFPVRLDDAVMDVPSGWAADIRRSRNIGDFRRWKRHDPYQETLTRLLRDLKTADAGKGASS